MSLKQVRTWATKQSYSSNTHYVQEIEKWVAALDAYDRQEFEESLRHFDQIADTSKILFNCGVIYATLGEHDKAVCPSMQ